MSKATLLDSRIKQYAYRETAQIYRDIGASPDGLSTDQVEIMREKYGTNSFAGRRDDTLLRRLRRAFINPFNVTLFILGIISADSRTAGKERSPAAGPADSREHHG